MSNIIRKAYPVLNMHSAGCAVDIEKSVKKLRGITDASVNPYDAILSVSYDADRLSPNEIRAALLTSGYDLVIEEEPVAEFVTIQQSSAYRLLKKRVKGAWIFTIPLLLLTVFSLYIPYASVIQMVLALVVIIFFGNIFYINAWSQFNLRRNSMDTLVVLSTSAAFLFSAFSTFFPDFWYSRGLEANTYYEVTVIVISFILTGKLMEERAKGNASGVIRQQRGLHPDAARYLPEEQRLDDRIAAFFVPVVLFFSGFTLLVWLFFGGTDMIAHALFAALSVLILACPCALGLATPIALIAGIGKAADNDILIKDAIALEQMSKVDVVVFDKAGTLTDGHPTITGWLWARSQEEHFKNVLLAAELKSSHPLAGTIVEALEEDRVLPSPVDAWEDIKGKGIKVSHKDAIYWVGSHKLLQDFQAHLSDVLGEMLAEYESDGNSIVYFGREDELLAIIAIKDQIKATSGEAIKELRVHDIEICMFTGDGERTASAVADSLGIMHFIADARSEDKEDFIRELQLQGKTVAMVGDGIKDSQALACADVSIVMAGATAMNVAMVTLVKPDLFLLSRAFRISYRTVKLMNKNLFWAFVFNIVCIPVAAGMLYPVYGIMLTPLLASAAMALSCVSVLINSLKT